MSLPVTEVRCHGCDYEGAIVPRPIVVRYRLPDGSTAQGGWRAGWCHQCHDIRPCEEAFNVADIKRDIHRETWGLGAKKRSEKIDNVSRLSALLWVAEHRHSKPRCLTCGSTNTEGLSFNESGVSVSFVHECGKHLYTVPDDPKGLWFSFNEQTIDLDTEGRVITSDSVRPTETVLIDLSERLSVIDAAERLAGISALLSTLCLIGLLGACFSITRIVYTSYGLAWSLAPTATVLLGMRFGVEALLAIAVTVLAFLFHRMNLPLSFCFYLLALASASFSYYQKRKQTEQDIADG